LALCTSYVDLESRPLELILKCCGLIVSKTAGMKYLVTFFLLLLWGISVAEIMAQSQYKKQGWYFIQSHPKRHLQTYFCALRFKIQFLVPSNTYCTKRQNVLYYESLWNVSRLVWLSWDVVSLDFISGTRVALNRNRNAKD
jgi:hypothetical protein